MVKLIETFIDPGNPSIECYKKIRISPPPPPDLIRYEMLGLLKVLNIVADNKIGYYFKFVYKIHINMVYIYIYGIYIYIYGIYIY